MATYLKIGTRRFRVPGSPAVRIALGILLVLCGLVGFLPILGFWMIPVGLLVLSVDFPWVRRWRRKMEIKWGRWRQNHRTDKAEGPRPDSSESSNPPSKG